jgi:hypothetical protein
MVETRSGSEVRLVTQLPHFLHTQETRPRTTECAGILGTEPELSHRQILHERNHRIYQWHWTSEFQNLLHLGPYFRILANEIGWKISASHGFHDPWQRPVSRDHFTYGAPQMSSLFSTSHGGSTSKPAEWDRLNWQPSGALQHTWTASPDPGTSSWMTQSEPSEN